MLVATRFLGSGRSGDQARRMWECVCDCGRSVNVSAALLKRLEKISCGCTRAASKHGMAKSPSYKIWAAMHDRCRNPSNRFFHRYGERGIQVCERWSGPGGFENFLADMGDKPIGRSIDRIDNDGHYSPENCRWATSEQQTSNRSSTRLITFNGETMMIKDWAARIGITPTTLALRIKRGWPLTDALTMADSRGIKHRRRPS